MQLFHSTFFYPWTRIAILVFCRSGAFFYFYLIYKLNQLHVRIHAIRRNDNTFASVRCFYGKYDRHIAGVRHSLETVVFYNFHSFWRIAFSTFQIAHPLRFSIEFEFRSKSSLFQGFHSMRNRCISVEFHDGVFILLIIIVKKGEAMPPHFLLMPWPVLPSGLSRHPASSFSFPGCSRTHRSYRWCLRLLLFPLRG